ncbi:MAG: insulinase family protein [Deltaproteobacteria bacterium]|nr:insulinase family protein [Deltaproteobacteria bacterium]
MERLSAQTLMKAYPLHHYRMDNGMQVYLLHNPISPVVTYLTHYSVGSASEGEGERGLAHFFEHMMFRETETLADGEFDRVVSEAGGVGLNAYTSYDTTAYYVNVPYAQVERVISLEADRMVHLRLSPELIEVERGAVLGELHMVKDTPSDQLWEGLMATAFDQHPYRHPIIGYLAQVQGFSDEDFRRFYRDHYAPNRAVLVVAGGFDEPALLKSLEHAYGHLTPGVARPAPSAPEPAWNGHRRMELRHPKVETDTLMIAARSPGMTHADSPALLLLSALLDAGTSAPLHRELVLTGIGTQTSAALLDNEMHLVSPGVFLLEVVLRHGIPAERAEEVLLNLLKRLAREGIAPGERERALNQLRLEAYGELRTNSSIARQVGSYAIACGDPLFGEKLLGAVGRVSTEDLVRVLNVYLLDASRLTVIQRPELRTAQESASA